MTKLDHLEAESIAILREVFACARNPVLLYSMGKDSSVLLRLAEKACFPAPLPMPLLHVDTTFKFREMYALRDKIAARPDLKLLVHQNPEALAAGINPMTHGSAAHTHLWKTVGLKQALDQHGFDFVVGGARRDEEKSRAKERIFSVRAPGHRWDPSRQRPELWNTFNCKLAVGETLRVFPLSNWTELDVWEYIAREKIDVVPLYFAAKRTVVERDGVLVMVDDARLPLAQTEKPLQLSVRFRTLGCYPLSGAVRSNAATIEQVILEMQQVRFSERQGRMIDQDAGASMELKKHEGYF
jgi:sulfate adenylyltransferase subunit 2